jgi:hypothetical protein
LDIKTSKKSQVTYFEEILHLAMAAEITDSWVSALEQCVKLNQRLVDSKQNSVTQTKQLSSAWQGRLRQVRSLLFRK